MSYKWKLSIKKLADTSDDKVGIAQVMADFLKLKKIHKLVAGKTQQSAAASLLRAQICELRSNLNSLCYEAYEVTLSLGKQHKFSEVFYEYPTTQDLRSFAERCKQEIRLSLSANKGRWRRQNFRLDRRNYVGIAYSVVGGVFSEKNSVLNIKKNYDAMARIRQSKAPHQRIKSNYVGIELEFLACVNSATLNELLVAAKLEGYVHLGTDSSVQPDGSLESKGYHGLELRVLVKEEDCADVVVRVCKVLQDAKCVVNNTCGMHVHFDMRNRNVETSFHNLVSNVDFLSSLVPHTRTKGPHGERYCRRNRDKNYQSAVQDMDGRVKYQIVNPLTFERLRTLEVRLHSGTLNPTKIVNWIKIITKILASNEKVPADVRNYKDFFEAYDVDSKLANYITARAKLFAVGSVTTAEDDKHSNYEMVG